MPVARNSLADTIRETLYLFQQGKSLEDICRIRDLKESTIAGHLEEACRAGETIEIDHLLNTAQQAELAAAFGRFGFANLTGLFESLNGRFSFTQLKLMRAHLQANLSRH